LPSDSEIWSLIYTKLIFKKVEELRVTGLTLTVNGVFFYSLFISKLIWFDTNRNQRASLVGLADMATLVFPCRST
jgi:hypothetical protein